MDNYPSNSNKSKNEMIEQPPKFEKVVSGPVSIRKKSDAERLFNNLVPADIAEGIGNILRTAAKKTIMEIITRVLYPDGRSYDSRDPLPGTRVSYRDYYDDRRRDDRDYRDRPSYSNYQYTVDSITFRREVDAGDLLNAMIDRVERDSYVSIKAYYEMAGVDSEDIPWTANNYGWTDLRSARISPTMDGRWYIKLPKAVAIRRI